MSIDPVFSVEFETYSPGLGMIYLSADPEFQVMFFNAQLQRGTFGSLGPSGDLSSYVRNMKFRSFFIRTVDIDWVVNTLTILGAVQVEELGDGEGSECS